MKLGWMYLYMKNLSNMKDSMYISFVMKPSIPKAKWRIVVGNNYTLYIAKKVLPYDIRRRIIISSRIITALLTPL